MQPGILPSVGVFFRVALHHEQISRVDQRLWSWGSSSPSLPLRQRPPDQRQRHNNTYITPQDAYRSCSGAFVSQTERAYSLCRRLSLRPQTLSCDQTAICSPGLPFNDLRPSNPWITTHLPTPEGWKAKLASTERWPGQMDQIVAWMNIRIVTPAIHQSWY